MNSSPFNDYAAKMQEVSMSDRLFDETVKRAGAERDSARTSPPARTRTRTGTAPPHIKRPSRIRGFALAACLGALAVTLGLSLALPGRSTIGGSGGAGTFTVKAYGSVDDTLFPTYSNDMIAFNCETETQRMLPPLMSGAYANEGFYTGCVFGVEGEDVARIQAHVSRGELYRVTGTVYSREEDPEFAEEAECWKPYNIGQGPLLGKYDYVAGVPYYGTVEADGENLGKDRIDPSRTAKVNLYQRLGSTIDTSALDAPEADAGGYRFGLWTNEPFDAAQPGNPLDYNPVPDLNAALDTLDGARLTVTVTFTDGRCATQVIDLHSADFKANVITTADGTNSVTELVPQIVDVPERSREEAAADYRQGIAYVHTLYGTVASETEEPFPHGGPSYPYLRAPLTSPRELGPEPAQAPGTGEASATAPGPFLEKDNVTGLAATVSYQDKNTVTAFERVERLDGLPAGVTAEDLVVYYPGSGGKRNEDTGDIDVRGRYSIAADGSLSPGFSYVLLTKTVTNTSNEQADVFLAQGFFAVLRPDGNGNYTAEGDLHSADPLWRSGHEGSALDSHYYFQTMEPGEVRTESLLYVVSDDMADDPALSFVYRGHTDMPDALAFRIGVLP